MVFLNSTCDLRPGRNGDVCEVGCATEPAWTFRKGKNLFLLPGIEQTSQCVTAI
jgi:hypothetical protein